MQRSLCSQLVSVFHSNGSKPVPAVTANLEEIGDSSALLLMEKPMRMGSRLRINCKSRELRGTVESCRVNEWLGFFVEIRFDRDSRWSPQWFAPEHLLTLAPAQLRQTA